MEVSTVEMLGISDPGIWMPFCIEMKYIYAFKQTSNDNTDALYDCTTLYAVDGEAYIIDTPFNEFKDLFIKYKNQ